jgi:hypothetical protein
MAGMAAKVRVEFDFMNLFVFGPGYTAQRFIDTYKERFTRICATYRSPEKAEALQASGFVTLTRAR